MKSAIEEGARNCVVECAQVKKGDSVLILNQSGSVDADVSEALAQAAKEEGAEVHILWGEPIPKTSDVVPKTLVGALLSSDVAVVTYPSLRREILHPHLKDKEVVRSGNAARTAELMGSEWARFPYTLQQAIIDKLDEIMEWAKSWHITTPQGTDIRGKFRGKDSVIAGAYFERDDGNTRFSRSFPGGVHTPFDSVGVEGVIMVEHLSSITTPGNALALDKPFRVEVKDNQIVSVDEEDEAGHILRQQIEERKEGAYQFIDSWHAGTNPKTVVPWDRKKDPRMWWNYAHWSPLAHHFHLGRSVNPITLCCFNQTVWVDGRKIYEDGRLAIVDDIGGIAKRYSEDLFANKPLPM
jgi:hypothetical protein